MLRSRVIPCLLVQEGTLVKTIRFCDPHYVGDPINAIRIYNEKEVDELLVLDISATEEKRGPDFGFLENLAEECFMPLAYGGGVRDLETMRRLFKLGIEKVALNSYALENPSFIRQAAEKYGNQSLILSMDVKKDFFGRYRVYSRRGRRRTAWNPVRYAQNAESLGAGEILVNAIERDGTMQGYDIDLIRQVSSAVNVPVIGLGGAGKVEDLIAVVREGGASAAAAGSLVVYQGKNRSVLINFPTAEELAPLYAGVA